MFGLKDEANAQIDRLGQKVDGTIGRFGRTLGKDLSGLTKSMGFKPPSDDGQQDDEGDEDTAEGDEIPTPSSFSLLSLLQRVPNQLEMAHRYIADHIIIEE